MSIQRIDIPSRLGALAWSMITVIAASFADQWKILWCLAKRSANSPSQGSQSRVHQSRRRSQRTMNKESSANLKPGWSCRAEARPYRPSAPVRRQPRLVSWTNDPRFNDYDGTTESIVTSLADVSLRCRQQHGRSMACCHLGRNLIRQRRAKALARNPRLDGIELAKVARGSQPNVNDHSGVSRHVGQQNSRLL